MADKHKFNEQIEARIATMVFDHELETSRANNSQETTDFEASIDLLENVRSEKNYDWRSDIAIPEFASVHLTDMSMIANQCFISRDYAGVYLEDDKPDSKLKCRAVKKCINEALNNPKIYHYAKYMRARGINSLYGMTWLKCWWDKERRKEVTGYKPITRELDVDELGNPLVDDTQIPATQTVDEPVVEDLTYIDRFNYDVIDPRHVFTSSEYCYSAQQKRWVIVWSEMSFEELWESREKNGYINLELLKPVKAPPETEFSQEGVNKQQGKGEADKTPIKPWDIYERFGKFWVVRGKDGLKPGIDEEGYPLDSAELIEMIITFATSGGTTVLIRFQECPYRTKQGLHYRPLVRGICYIHPTKDIGLSDGKYARDLNVAINDTFNISNDRVQLATLPVMKARKYALEDNSTVYIAPEHVIELENPREDLEWLETSDNIQGAMLQMDTLTKKLHAVTSIFPNTMGDVGQASTTATAIAGSESRTNMRMNYKSLTAGYTLDCELYWMIIQMTYQFAEADTALKMMGEDVYYFDPEDEYTYLPLPQNIEQEQSKYRKLQTIDQFIGRLASVPNPKTFTLINKLISKAFELMGEEYSDYRDALLDENAPPPLPAGSSGASQIPAMGGMGASNQNMVPQSGTEMMVRGGMMGMR